MSNYNKHDGFALFSLYFCMSMCETIRRTVPGRTARITVPVRYSTGSLQDLEEQKRTKYKINGTATTAIEKSNPNRPAKSRLPYSYQPPVPTSCTSFTVRVQYSYRSSAPVGAEPHQTRADLILVRVLVPGCARTVSDLYLVVAYT